VTELAINVDSRRGDTVVAVHGKIMYDTLQPLDRALKEILAAPAPRVVLDLHKVALCDSSGLQLFLDTRQHAVAAGGWLRLCGPQAMVRRVLEITNLTSILPVYESVDAAVSAPESTGSGPPSGNGPPSGRRTDNG
jgi:anti-anti-sigma factor